MSKQIMDSWRRLRLECELAQYYKRSYLLLGGTPFSNPIVDQLLPVSLHVRAVALFSKGVAEAYVARNLKEQKHLKTFRSKVERQARHLAETGVLSNGEALWKVLSRRRTTAHEATESVPWAQLREDVQQLQTALEELGQAHKLGKLEYFGERSGLRDSNEPGIIATHDYRFGITEDGKVAIEVRLTERIHSDG